MQKTLCANCAHYIGDLKCSAFPGRIPDDILVGSNNHSKPEADQWNSDVFEPRSAKIKNYDPSEPREPAGGSGGGQWTSGGASGSEGIKKLLKGNYETEQQFREAYQKTIVNEGKDRPIGEDKTGGTDRGSGGSDGQVSESEKEQLQKTVDGYLSEYGQEFGVPGRVDTNVVLDESRSLAISTAYDQLPIDDSANPKVKEAYDELAKEVGAQYEYLTKELGVKVVFTSDDPYKTSKEMVNDVVHNNTLRVYSGGGDHPLLGSVTKDENGITANEKFRAVHDYFGHSIEQNQFGKLGEERAWVAHSKMFSPLAQSALTTETRGQNSWVNFSGANKSSLAKMAEGNRLIKAGQIDAGKKLVAEGQGEFKFATQKVGLLPSDFWNWRVYSKGGLLRKTKNYNSDEPRAPAGAPEGGQWTALGGYSESMRAAVLKLADRAKAVGDELMGAVKKVASKYQDAIAAPINYKKVSRIAEKAQLEYGGNVPGNEDDAVSKIKDAVRTEIIVKSEDDVTKILDDFKADPNTSRIKFNSFADGEAKTYERSGDTWKEVPNRADPLGWRSINVNYKLSNGLIGEIQIQTAAMLYAKEPGTKNVMGESLFEKIRQAVNMPDGLGHLMYEQYRVLDFQTDHGRDGAADIERKSKDYYKHFWNLIY